MNLSKTIIGYGYIVTVYILLNKLPLTIKHFYTKCPCF